MSKAMEALLGAVKKSQSGFSKDNDDVFYYPVRDAVGNGSAVIRFLPSLSDDEVPFVKTYTHGFKGPSGKWLIDNCLTTIEKECPVCIENSKNYAKMSKEDARKMGMNRKVSFITRILVVEDKKTPENEGKVFLYKFGQKIFDKIVDKLQPEFEDDAACNIFDLKEGANFKLKIRKADGQTSYDKSEFDSSSVCSLKPSDLQKHYNAENDIQKFLKEDQFKPAAKLQERLNIALGTISTASQKDDEAFEQLAKKSAPAPVTRKVVAEEDDDVIMGLVRSLAED